MNCTAATSSLYCPLHLPGDSTDETVPPAAKFDARDSANAPLPLCPTRAASESNPCPHRAPAHNLFASSHLSETHRTFVPRVPPLQVRNVRCGKWPQPAGIRSWSPASPRSPGTSGPGPDTSARATEPYFEVIEWPLRASSLQVDQGRLCLPPSLARTASSLPMPPQMMALLHSWY